MIDLEKEMHQNSIRNASKFDKKWPIFYIFEIFFTFFVIFLYKRQALRGGVKEPPIDPKFFLVTFHNISAQKKKANKILKKVGNMVHPTV